MTMKTIENENLAIAPLFMITFVLTFFTIATFFFCNGLEDSFRDDRIQHFQEQRPAAYIENDAKHEARINSYATIDKAADQYQIPIERAMDLVVQERAAK